MNLPCRCDVICATPCFCIFCPHKRQCTCIFVHQCSHLGQVGLERDWRDQRAHVFTLRQIVLDSFPKAEMPRVLRMLRVQDVPSAPASRAHHRFPPPVGVELFPPRHPAHASVTVPTRSWVASPVSTAVLSRASFHLRRPSPDVQRAASTCRPPPRPQHQ